MVLISQATIARRQEKTAVRHHIAAFRGAKLTNIWAQRVKITKFLSRIHTLHISLSQYAGLWTKSVNNCKLSYNSTQKRLKSHNNLRI